MAMADQIQAGPDPHEEAEELLPWYATGQLDRDEASRVEQHLLACAKCRAQLSFDRRMVSEFADLTPQIDSGWLRLQQRLQLGERTLARPTWWQRLATGTGEIWQALMRPSIAALAVAQLAFLIVAGSVLLSLSRPSYRALGSAPPPQSANIIAMFRTDTTESQLRSLLNTNGASLVGGPTATDAYLLRVPAQSRNAVLSRMRADRHVIMAEPIEAASS
jgi:hypothetical protein